jgi:acetyl esterase/lipase
MKEPGGDGRHRDEDGELSQKRSDPVNKNLSTPVATSFRPMSPARFGNRWIWTLAPHLLDFLIFLLVLLLLAKGLVRLRAQGLYRTVPLYLLAFFNVYLSFRGITPCRLIIGLFSLPSGSEPDHGDILPGVSSDSMDLSAAAGPVGPPLQATFADLSYAHESPLQKLDLYLPALEGGAAPLVIWIHGGALRVGDKSSMPRRNLGPPPKPRGRNGPYQIQVPDVAALTARGYAVASLNYRLGSWMVTAAAPAIRDGKAAVRFLRANAAKYGLDPERFAVWGNSAGGYMAAMMGATGDQATIFDEQARGGAAVSSAVQAVVVWFGAEDRLLFPRLDINNYLPIAKTLPPFRIVNGDADPVISPLQARRLHQGLIKVGATSSLTILPGAGHEDPVFMATQMAPTLAFLDRTFGC